MGFWLASFGYDILWSVASVHATGVAEEAGIPARANSFSSSEVRAAWANPSATSNAMIAAPMNEAIAPYSMTRPIVENP